MRWGPHKLRLRALQLQNEAGHTTCGKFVGRQMQLHPSFKGLTFITTGTPKCQQTCCPLPKNLVVRLIFNSSISYHPFQSSGQMSPYIGVRPYEPALCGPPREILFLKHQLTHLSTRCRQNICSESAFFVLALYKL